MPAKQTKNSPTTDSPAAKRGFLRTFAGPVLGIVALIVVGRLAGSHWPEIEAKVSELGNLGYLLFVGAWIVLASACFPVSVLGFSAGALFGMPLGVSLVFTSAMLAATVMFGLGRGLMRGRIRDLIATRPKLAAVDRLAGEKALRLNILTRLSPLNYGLACYTLAAGRTNLKSYLLGNVASLPSMVLQAWLGTLAVQTGKSVTGEGMSPRNLVMAAAGLIFVGVLMWQIGRMIKQAVAEAEQDDIS